MRHCNIAPLHQLDFCHNNVSADNTFSMYAYISTDLCAYVKLHNYEYTCAYLSITKRLGVICTQFSNIFKILYCY